MARAVELIPDGIRPAMRAAKRATWDRLGPDAAWAKRGYSAPAPTHVKWEVLLRYGLPAGTWVETGTYMGDTTAFLARRARSVITIEPSPQLARAAAQRFAAASNVTVLNALSEDVLPSVLEGLDGATSFWLDGHFSEGVTFQGPTDTPIREELDAIGASLSTLGPVTVLVDDVRCFDPQDARYRAYPPREWLVEWALAHDLSWTIEHDIFVAWRS